MIKGKHPVLLNVTYLRPSKRDDEIKQEEAFEVIYKDDNGEVHRSLEPPDVDIYITKPEYRDYSYNKPEERIDHMDKIRVPFSKIRDTIIKSMGDETVQWAKEMKRNGDYKALNQVYAWPYCYGCDFQPEHYYMRNWYEKYWYIQPTLTKGFIDIEVDQIDGNVNLANINSSAIAPVNCATIIFAETMDVWTLILRPYKPSHTGYNDEEYKHRYELYENQMKAHNDLLNNVHGFLKECADEFNPVYGNLKYHLREFSEEIDLIASIFVLINNYKPNFMEIWNMRFDIQYLYYRIQMLGYNPSSIMCHPDFENPKCYFKVDRSTFELEKQFDYFYCSSYTQYICQMRLYASIRKSQHKLKSVSLNAIADIELKDHKVEYADEGNITMFAYSNWIKFIKYNIKDAMLQFGIEKKTNDVMTYYARSQLNLTPYNKIFKETHLLRNVREHHFENDGWVQSNNLNTIDTGNNNKDPAAEAFYGSYDSEDNDEEASYKGAIMADPLWNDYVGMIVLGHNSNNLFENSIDYDMSAFYPSIKIASNMDPITLLYKASFVNYEFICGEYNNRSLNNKYEEKDKNGKLRKIDITGEAVNTYCSGNILTFGYNYLNMPSQTDVINRVFSILRDN